MCYYILTLARKLYLDILRFSNLHEKRRIESPIAQIAPSLSGDQVQPIHNWLVLRVDKYIHTNHMIDPTTEMRLFILTA